MLKANKCAALFLGEKGNAIYRIHDLPDPDKIKSFFKFMGKLNYKVESDGKVKGTFLQKILEEVKGTKNARVVNTLLLRSMKQAVYHVDNIGHYGLGFKDYTHFTSPIRRYPDLMVHRLIKHKLGIGDKVQKYENKNFLSKIALRSSKTERTAMEAEREIVKIKSARFIEKYIGEVFDGIITGLAEFGFFVQILQFGIEGLIRNRYLNDVFTFDEENYIMRGKNGKTYELGDEIKVQIISVNIKRGFIDFKNV
jgi:ribonuclease R